MDLFAKSPFNPNNFATYYAAGDTSNGQPAFLHPNNAGWPVLAPLIAMELVTR